MPSALAPARPDAVTASASRPRRALVALGLAAALTGGGLVATAPEASAAPTATSVQAAAKAKPTVHTRVSRHSIVKNKTRATLVIRATKNGHAVRGKARIAINGRYITAKKLDSRGRAVFAPATKYYRTGKNAVRLAIVPSSGTGLAKTTRTIAITGKSATSRSAKLVKVAKAQVGDRYRYGASGPHSFDCSGLTRYVYKKATGKTLPRSSSAQKAAGKVVSRKNARPGDIIWTPGHVSIYVGNGKQVEAARPGVGVVKRHIWQDNPRFIRI